MNEILFDPQLLMTAEPVLPVLDAKDSEAVASALEIAFFASLSTNEGRSPEFSFVVLSDISDISSATRLITPEPLTPERLNFLAPAFDPEERCLIVAPDKQKQLKIFGIRRTPYPPRFSGIRLPPLVLVDGPGRVALLINDKHVLYDRGRLRWEDEDCLKEWVSESTDHIVGYVSTPTELGQGLRLGLDSIFKYDEHQWNLHEATFRRHARDIAPHLISGSLRLIAKRVKDARHGGALLLLPEAAIEEVASDGRWFIDGQTDLQHWVLTSAALRTHLSLALEGIWVIADLNDDFKKDPSRWAREVLKPRFDDALHGLEFSCQQCARFTQVDGTVVLGTDLRVLGFGARLKAPKPQNLPDGCQEFLSSRGTRHSSMACAVDSLDGALGIVISQDGHAVVFNKPAGMPLEHRELIL